MTIEDLFFELLQVAIGNRKELSRIPSAEEWKELFALSKKQALTAVAMVAVSKLNCVSDYGASLGIPEVVYLKWLGLTAKVAQRNRQVTEACVELVKLYARDGIATCILKGQGNLVNYPEELRECRTPGDIDVWCKTVDDGGIDIAVSDLDGKGAHYQKYHGNEAVIEYVKMLHRIASTEPHEGVRYHHIDAPAVGACGEHGRTIEVEAHFRPLFLDSPLRNHRLQKWFKINEQFGVHDAKIGDCVIPTPTVSFNAVYQLVHIYRHLFDEGVGLRQLLDYYFVLRALHIEQETFADRTQSMAQWAEGMGVAVKSNEEIIHILSRFGMKKFAGAVMYVLQTVFAMPDEYLICPSNQKEGKFLLNEILQAGNFGKYDDRIKHGGTQSQHAWEKTKHNLRLLTHYPEEVLWEPFFRVYHWIWRRLELWRY